MSEMWRGPRGRREATTTSGVRTMDRAHAQRACARCGAVVEDPNVFTIGTIGYRTIAELIAWSRQGLALVEHGVAPRCCGVEAEVVAVDYHAFHGGRRMDLVLRWTREASAPTTWWWDGTAYVAAEVTDDEGEEIVGDAYLRRATSRLEVEGIEAALDDIEIAQQEVPHDRAILAFVEPLLEAGYLTFAQSILDDYDGGPGDEEAARLRARVAAREQESC